MILRIDTAQVVDYWPILQLTATEALPPYVVADENVINNIMSALLRGQMQGWVVVEREEGRPVRLIAAVITEICVDEIAGARNLMVYALYGAAPEGVSLKHWFDIKNSLAKYAACNGCKKLVAYSNSDAAIKVVKKMGGQVEYRFLSLDLEREEEKQHDEG